MHATQYRPVDAALPDYLERVDPHSFDDDGRPHRASVYNCNDQHGQTAAVVIATLHAADDWDRTPGGVR